jgi:uncharacterized phage protein (TIGR02218 family)
MSFSALQDDLVEGKPVRLFEFKIGKYGFGLLPEDPGYDNPAQQGTTVYRYCDADSNISVAVGGGPEVDWTGIPLNDKGITINGQAAGDVFELTLPISLPLAQRFRQMGPPSQTIALFVYEVHMSDSLLEAQPVWVGEVGEVNFPTADTAVFQCHTLAAAFQRTGLRLTWSKQCPHVLYDGQCRLKLVDFLVPVTVTAIVDGAVITLDTALDANIYPGGLLVWTNDDGYNETIGIESVSGFNVTVFGSTATLVGVTAASAARGCKRNPEACAELGNYDNYGGCPHIPEKSPFDGTPNFW